MGKMVEFKRPDGASVQGYLAEPAQASGAPGLVVIQEWWGLNAQIKGVADRFAEAGYVALVPDLYRGKSTVEAAEAEHLMTNLNFGDAAGQDVRGAVHLPEGSVARRSVSPASAWAARSRCWPRCTCPRPMPAWCGTAIPPLEYIDASKIKMPLMGHYAIDDVPFPIATVDALEGKLRAAKVSFEFHRYKAMHAFANETQVGANRLPITEYNPEAAALAWTRTLAFFGQHLR